MDETRLKRTLSLPMITFYGLGTIIGGGFYALVGTIAGKAGMYAPVSYLVSSTIAFFCALSYSELSARLPYSAGEPRFVLEAFRRNWLSSTVGWMVIMTGVVSAATLANAFSVFLQTLVAIPDSVIIIAVVIGMGAIAAWGIGQSAIFALVITIIEIGGLLFILLTTGDKLAEVPERLNELAPPLSMDIWSGIFLGGFIAFYSFIGFEDMVNLAEEVKNPQRNLPIAILLSLALTTLIYVLVVLTAVLSIPPAELAKTGAPLATLIGTRLPFFGKPFVVIGMLAGINGALVQIIMASRVAYGMSEKKIAPKWFSMVHPKTKTPMNATITMTAIVLVLALWFPLVGLAQATSFIILLVFALVNLSLFIIKVRDPRPRGVWLYPIWIPVIGFLLCSCFVVFRTLNFLGG